jgi:trehalose 6-phosphate synthase
VVVVAAVAAVAAYFQVRQEKAGYEKELARRASLIADGLQEAIEPLLESGRVNQLDRLVERFGNRERLAGVAVYNAKGELISATARLSFSPAAMPQAVSETLQSGADAGTFERIGDRELHVHARLLQARGQPAGALAVFHDPSYIRSRLWGIWRDTFFRVLAQAVLMALVTLLIVRWSITGPIAQMAEWMRQLRSGETSEAPVPRGVGLFTPLAREVQTFASHLSRARAAAEEEARLRQTAESLWTPERLGEHVRHRLQGKPLIVVSNREPYMHIRRGRAVECIVPAGGLVTSLDPVLRAAGGTWIAHGSGDADWESVDDRNRIRVPTEDPRYTLKRVALSKEEETGYYYGFANEGLWPLCHIAHTRPTFRPEDWAHYQRANQKFARSTLDEMEGLEEPCVLVQDYHLALLPRLIKEERPDARVAIFWHIPWTNPEAFGICPWQRELLSGMLGADLIGFHTQFHCNNFLDTVDSTLESRLDWERFAVQREGRLTLVKPFPISVAFPAAFQDIPPQEGPPEDRKDLLAGLGVGARYVGVGVERMDYTKGVLERFRAIERFFDNHPEYRGELTFIQLGAPSRTQIKRYSDFLAEVEAEAERINAKFKPRDWKPIVLLKGHHSHREILPFYRHADFCMVTSLHDGMNLVAKEFVASREDESGVLILSRFAGASRELRDALIVNPYDVEQMAEAIRRAIEMSEEEKALRMKKMREVVREHNIFRWAGNLIEALTQVRIGEVRVPSV